MSHGKLLEVDRAAVRQKCGKSDKDVEEYIDTIKKWFDQQPHLPEVPSAELIEYFLVSNKFSTEKTKSKLDMYYTVRSLMPEVFRDNQPWQPHLQETAANAVLCCPLPKQTPELYRVTINKIVGDPNAFHPYLWVALLMNIYEIRMNEDLHMGDVVVFDYEEIKLAHILKLTPTYVQKCLIILEKVLSNRVKAFHFINSPPFIDTLVKILKNVMKPKLFERVHVHTKSVKLTDYISKEILPKDYGGDELSLDEFVALWNDKFTGYEDRFNKLNKMTVDEKLRPTPLENNELLGYYGNFKKLNID